MPEIKCLKSIEFEQVYKKNKKKLSLLPYFSVPHVYLLSRWETFMPLKFHAHGSTMPLSSEFSMAKSIDIHIVDKFL